MKMKELFAQPGTWCTGVFSRDAQGRQSSLSGQPPVSFCLMGAVYECYPEEVGTVLTKIENALDGEHPAKWNDTWNRTQEEVLQLCERLDI